MRATRVVLLSAVICLGCWTESSPDDDDSPGAGNCDDLNCTDLLHIHIERRDEAPFVPGNYTLEVEIDPERLTKISCTLDETDVFSCIGAPTGGMVTINAVLTTITVRMETTPRQLIVTLYYEDEEIGSAVLTPKYEIIAQSDPSCQETCYEGSATLKTIAIETPQRKRTIQDTRHRSQ